MGTIQINGWYIGLDKEQDILLLGRHLPINLKRPFCFHWMLKSENVNYRWLKSFKKPKPQENQADMANLFFFLPKDLTAGFYWNLQSNG